MLHLLRFCLRYKVNYCHNIPVQKHILKKNKVKYFLTLASFFFYFSLTLRKIKSIEFSSLTLDNAIHAFLKGIKLFYFCISNTITFTFVYNNFKILMAVLRESILLKLSIMIFKTLKTKHKLNKKYENY